MKKAGKNIKVLIESSGSSESEDGRAGSVE